MTVAEPIDFGVFTCPICRETFAKQRPDQAALVEAQAIHGEILLGLAQDPVCDDCFAYLAFYYGWDLSPVRTAA